MSRDEILRLIRDEGLRKQLQDEFDQDLEALGLERGSVDEIRYVIGRMLGREYVREAQRSSNIHHKLILAMVKRKACLRLVKTSPPQA